MTDHFDQLLSAPLPEIADDGFSAKVMARLYRSQQSRSVRNTLAIGAGALVVIPFLPMRVMLDTMLPLLANSGTLIAIGLAGVAMVLTVLLEREIAQG